jgi:hypothetical protein
VTGVELTATVPADTRFAATLTALATTWATHAGCDAPGAADFAGAVGDALHRFAAEAYQSEVTVVLRRLTADVEAILTCGQSIRVARPVRIDV